jgi:ElaB/YqjD/DUF883 family membrane-anchored ribosome-binding protein
MSDARYSSSDIPNFDTYPLSSPPGGSLQASSSESLPFGSQTRSGLEIRAARLGSALGQFVLLLRRQQEVAQQKLSIATDDATAALNRTADSVKVRAEQAGQVASNKAQELLIEAERRGDQLRHRATLNLQRAKVRAREIQRDNPESVAIGAGAVGLALGIGLRIWRASRA